MAVYDEYFEGVRLSNPAYAVKRIAGMAIRERAETYLSGRIIEIGCGSKQKGLLIGDLVEEHIGLDHQQCPHGTEAVDLIGTAYDIPAPDGSFDCALSTAVSEHLEDPLAAFKEARRVLKPGGYAIYTAPFFWHLHEEPRDFYRFTKYGLRHLFSTAGFEVLEIVPLSGFLVTFGSELGYYLTRFRGKYLGWLIDAVVAATQWLVLRLDRGRLRDERFTWMYLAVVRNPKSTTAP